MRGLSKIASLASFLVELAIYSGFVTAYFLLILHFLGGWIDQVFEYNKILYAILALALIGSQGYVLERLTTVMAWVIQRLQAIIPVIYRLTRPHETITRPEEVPGLLVYRFASPLFSFNANYFARRVQEAIDAADPPVTFFLIVAEAIFDIDLTGLEVLAELHNTLKSKKIVLGLCEVKGHFRKVLMGSGLPRRVGFNVYPSVAAVVEELTKEQSKKKKSKASEGTVPGS